MKASPQSPRASTDPFEEIRRALLGLWSARHGLIVLVVSLLGFLLVINSSWKATPDSALYLELGQSLAGGKGYVFNGEPHTYVPPGFPALVAVAVATAGEDFLTYRILMALLAMLTAGAGFLFVYRMCGADVAFFAGGLFAVNHTLLSNCTFTTSDVPFALVSLVALNAVLRAGGREATYLRVVPVGLLIGLPALVRVNGWGLPPAAALFLWSSLAAGSRRRIGLVVVFLLAALIPTVAWEAYKAHFPISQTEGSYFDAVTGRGLWTQAHIIVTALLEYVPETFDAVAGVSVKTGVIEGCLAIVMAVGAVAVFKNGERLLVPLTVIQFGGLALSPAGSRYLLLLIPGLYLFLALGLIRVHEWAARRLGSRAAWIPSQRGLLVGVFCTLAVLNVGHNVGTIIQARTALEKGGAESAHDLPFFVAARWLKSRQEQGPLLTMHPRVVHFLSGIKTVELVRSGVPEHEVWVDRREAIGRLIQEHHPTFFFSDSANERLFKEAEAAAESLGLRLEEIPEASVSHRFRLWRLRPAG